MVENKGESAMTTNPQNIKNVSITAEEDIEKTIGESRQHKPDDIKAKEAIRFSP